MKKKPSISVVVPLHNEEKNVLPMYKQISKALTDLEYEIIFVDDGSYDSTLANALSINDDKLTVIRFTRNFGQTSAMAAGIAHAKCNLIATLDGDLQNDPADIPAMVTLLQKEKLDLVAGKRKKRQDAFVLRKLPSMIANFLIRKSTGVKLSDTGCSLKVFTKALGKRLELYGELHRFIPAIASMHGARIAEKDVKHYSRKYGYSKYGISRTMRVISDLFLMLFFLKYRQKPMHFFGSLAQVSIGLGSLMMFYLGFLKLFGQDIGHRPMLFISILLLITGIQFLTTGFIAELVMRANFAASKKTPYNIEAIYQGGKVQE